MNITGWIILIVANIPVFVLTGKSSPKSSVNLSLHKSFRNGGTGNFFSKGVRSLVIESADDALLPTAGTPRTYRLYFSPLQSVYPKEYWEELHGGTPVHLVLAFDILSFDPARASAATLSLDSARLFTIDLNNL